MSKAAEVITVTFGGMTFRTGRRTYAHLLWTQEQLDRRHPGARLMLSQPSYNTGVVASAGTHDLDAVLDGWIEGLDWWKAQRFLRECGWACWFRFPPLFIKHLHFISLGYGDAPVGVFVPGQVSDYYARALGLKNQHNPGSDTSWFPPDIDRTIFDYDRWLEDHMPFTDWPQKDRDALVDAVVRGILAAPVANKNPDGTQSTTTLGKMLTNLEVDGDRIKMRLKD